MACWTLTLRWEEMCVPRPQALRPESGNAIHINISLNWFGGFMRYSNKWPFRHCVPPPQLLYFSSSTANWHVLLCPHTDWLPLYMKYWLFIRIWTGRGGTEQMSTGEKVFITMKVTVAWLFRSFKTIIADLCWTSICYLWHVALLVSHLHILNHDAEARKRSTLYVVWITAFLF